LYLDDVGRIILDRLAPIQEFSGKVGESNIMDDRFRLCGVRIVAKIKGDDFTRSQIMTTEAELLETALEWQSMVVRGQPSQIDELLQRLEANLPQGWVHDQVIEERIKAAKLFKPGARCYSYTTPEGQPIVALWLVRSEPNCLRSGMSSPLGRIPALEDERMVGEFLKFYRPLVESLKLDVEHLQLRRPHPFEGYLSLDTFRELEAFVASLSKNAHELLPSQRKQWTAFVIKLHRRQETVDPDRITDWLTQQGLQATVVEDLIEALRTTLYVVRQYDETWEEVWR
jgi:hypothetical protein